MNQRPSIYDYGDYKKFVTGVVDTCEQYGRGSYQRMAQHLRVNTTFISQVFRGDKHLSIDQAYQMTQFLALSAAEAKYFVLLVQHERSGNHETRKFFAEQLEELKNQSAKVSAFVPKHHKLDPRDQALFYSDAQFSAVRLLTGIPGYQNPEAIAERLTLEKRKVVQILEFLVSSGLCTYHKGRYGIGHTHTHADKDSLFVNQHHINWRLKAWKSLPQRVDEEMAFTAPLTISHKDAKRIYKELCKTIKAASQIVESSPPQDLHCLLIDFFRV